MLYRLFTSALCCFIFLGSLALFRPAWAEHLGLDVWNVGDELERLASIHQNTNALRDKQKLARERSKAFKAIVDDVLRGASSLREAALRTRPLLEEISPEYRELFLPLAGATEKVRLGRLVIGWVRIHLQGRETMPQSAALLADLERQLEAID